ncbi:hypothetical protein KC352_g6807, partial [Hortaea werneckii]
MSPDEVVQKALEVIGEAVSLEPDDLQDHETWKFLGLGENLQNATASDLSSALDFAVAPKDFQTYLDVGSFKSFLQQKASRGNGTEAQTNGTSAAKSTLSEPEDPWEGIPKPKVPLSVVLQGKPDTAKTIMFLFPDGSGAGTSYGTLP